MSQEIKRNCGHYAVCTFSDGKKALLDPDKEDVKYWLERYKQVDPDFTYESKPLRSMTEDELELL